MFIVLFQIHKYIHISYSIFLVSGKTWGDQRHLPVLLIHGIFDNAGSFDYLISMLPKCYFYVCIDLPSHGKSTHFQKGVLGNFLNFVVAIKYVVDYFKWKKLYYVGHSFGGQIGLYMTSIYPNLILKFIIIDSLPPKFMKIPETLKNLRELFDEHMELINKLQKSKPPQYTYNEALEKMISIRRTNMLPEHAAFLAQRTLIRTDDHFIFSNDPQLRLLPYPLFSVEQVKDIITGIVCPTLIIFTTDSIYNIDLHKNEKVINVYFNMKNVRYHSVKGNHDVHMMSPEVVAPVISDFLNEEQCHL